MSNYIILLIDHDCCQVAELKTQASSLAEAIDKGKDIYMQLSPELFKEVAWFQVSKEGVI